MNFDYSDKARDLQWRLQQFMDEEIYPVEHAYQEYLKTAANPWASPPLMVELKAKAKKAGLWNLFLPARHHPDGLSNLDYAPLAEIMGRVLWAPEVFNCNAPDTGNMEVFIKYGTEAQKARWLEPLLAGEIRSAFAMTEPDVASSDATNVQCSIVRDGDEYVINGRKWFITGADGAAFAIVLARTPGGATMFLVDASHPGYRLGRAIPTIDSFSPGGHSELEFVDCEVGDDAVLGEVDRGFEHAQYRLAPARLTHCMRWLGAAVRATEIAQRYVTQRESFGRKLSEHQAVQTLIADSHIDVLAARAMIAHAAARLDALPPTKVKHESSMTKVFVSEAVHRVIDRAVQVCGGWGTTEESMLAHLYRDARPFRIYDGANEVHRASIARRVLARGTRP